jgi:hypothetical protein
MAASIWHYLENQFENVTKNNNKLSVIIANDHDSKLQAESGDPEILVFYNRFHPLKIDLSVKYGLWVAAKGLYKGETARVEQKLAVLSGTAIESWDIQVQVVHKRETPDYIALLPNFRIPFQSGGIDLRIEELRGFSTRLNSYAALAAVKAEVDAFLAVLEGFRNVQQGKEETVGLASDNLKASKLACMIMSYRNLGGLIDKFGSNPSDVERFYELELLQQTPLEDEPVLVVVPGGETLNLLEGGFDSASFFILINTGATPLRFFITNSASGTWVTNATGDGMVEIPAGGSETASASQLGFMPGWNFFNVTNLDNAVEGSCSVSVE